MSADLNSLSLACKQAEARHETAYAFMQLVPALASDNPAWAPAWAKLRELREALDSANAAYLAGIRGRERYQSRLRTAAACPVTPLDEFHALLATDAAAHHNPGLLVVASIHEGTNAQAA